MIGAVTQVVKSKEGKQVLFILGTAVLVMTALHYYNQIKLTRMKIKEMEKKEES
jgi:hypothetical protein